jgi:hypothetical protein
MQSDLGNLDELPCINHPWMRQSPGRSERVESTAACTLVQRLCSGWVSVARIRARGIGGWHGAWTFGMSPQIKQSARLGPTFWAEGIPKKINPCQHPPTHVITARRLLGFKSKFSRTMLR